MIRIVHTLSGSGGTLLSRCLGALPGIALLSEINPLAVHLFPEFHPLYQDEHWLHLLTPEDRQRFAPMDLGQFAAFRELIKCFWERARAAGKSLILRDYNHVDFIGIPYVDEPPRRRVLYDALPEGIPTAAIAFVRHPIDQWTSICKHEGVGDFLPVGFFCDAYAAFLDSLGSTPIFRYEDFVRDPDGQMNQICRHLQLPFDPSFRQNFSTFSSLTGDFSRQGEAAITLPHKAPPPAALVNRFRSEPDYFRVLHALQYPELPTSSATVDKSATRRPQAAKRLELPESALETALVSEGDERFPNTLDSPSLVLNRIRLARFLAEFAEDADVADLLALDIWGNAAGIPLSSTGRPQSKPELALRPFRLWEYTWLYKSLGLRRAKSSSGRPLKLLDLGGPASHVTVLAALAGAAVTSIDLNPEFVRAGQACAEALNLPNLRCLDGDMRDLSGFPSEGFDAVISCSVLEHLSAVDQETAMRQIARVLRPGGLVGLSFDVGPSAPNANEDLPRPHDPPPSCQEAFRRYSQGGLLPAGVRSSEDAVPGSLFHEGSVSYTIASLVLGKPPVPTVNAPVCVHGQRGILKLPQVQDLPFRLQRYLTSNPLTRRVVALQAVAASRQTQLSLAAKHTELLQTIAEERLATMQKIQAVAEERLAMMQKIQTVAEERLVAMQKTRAVAAERLVAMQKIRAVADERLVAMQKIQTVADERLTTMQKIEKAAGERLELLQGADKAAALLRAELEARDTTIANLKKQLEDAERPRSTGK